MEPPRDLSRLPLPLEPGIIGRELDLARLDDAWKDPGTNVFTLVAFGGTGKSALVTDWIDLLSKRNQWEKNVAALAWTFSGPGTETPVEPFFEWALRLCGDPAPSRGEPQERGARLAKLLQQWRTLLVLDGVESLQYQYADGPPLAGKLKDPGLSSLLRELALANRGLCVVTTQDRIRELDSFQRAAPQHTLEDLPEEEAVKLLQRLTGVIRKTQDVLDAVSAAQRHALTLTLLGNFLAKTYPGNFKAWREVGLHEAYGPEGVASQMIAAYAKRLDGHMLSILRVLALYDRPIEIKILRVLQDQPVVQGITDGLMGRRERERWMAVQELRRQGLLITGRNVDSLDAHPLVRAYFARELQERQTEAWQAGHLLLYNLYRNAPPDSLGSIQPLLDAMRHGCLAGRQQEVFDEIYDGKVRRQNGHLRVSGSELTALATFFDPPWDNLSTGLNERSQASVFNEAGVLLRTLGRLQEAVIPLELSLKKWEAFPEEKRDASTIAANLSELMLTVGNVKEAVEHGYRSVGLARESGNASAEIITGLARVAAALHQAGQLQESGKIFQEAEEIQAKQRPDRPRLSALRGYQYCDLLLSLGEPTDGSMLDGLHASRSKADRYRNACEGVVRRAEEMLSWSEQAPGIFGGALDHLALGQAKLGLAITTSPEEEASFQEALEHLNEAVERIQQRHLESYLPSALLARAKFHLSQAADLEQAKRDLEKALEIADSGPMRLHSCDAHCGFARLSLLQGDVKSAGHHIGEARKLVEETGYLRRKHHVKYLEDSLIFMERSSPVVELIPKVPEIKIEPGKPGVGQGATVAPAQATVFISYSRSEARWKERLAKQLRILELESLLRVFEDDQISAGDDWLPRLEKEMEDAKVAVLMISPAFLNSEFIRKEEVPKLLTLRREAGLRVIPLLVDHCPLKEVGWLSKIQGRPQSGAFLTSMRREKAERELASLAREILRLLKNV